MISDEELAAVFAAISALTPSATEAPKAARLSRWKLSERYPELELEDIRAV